MHKRKYNQQNRQQKNQKNNWENGKHTFRPPTRSTNVNTRPPQPIVQRPSRPR